MKLEIKGVWAPLITPLFDGKFDKQSTLNLLQTLEPFVNGLAPCLSSGEGAKMDRRLWEEVVGFIVQNTSKPVAAGILKDNLDDIISFTKRAKELGCSAVVVPMVGRTAEEKQDFAKKLSNQSHLPIIIYNTEKFPISDMALLKKIVSSGNFIAIKDSSRNQSFFNQMIQARKAGALDIFVLQGMDNQLLKSVGCDGYMIALTNVEPQLCWNMFINPSKKLNDAILRRCDDLNLSKDQWYMYIKKAMLKNNRIKSAEVL